MFDQLIEEVAQRFGLGDKAGTLVRSLVGMMTDESRGGLTGFLSAFDEGGMGSAVSSWVANGSGEEIDASHVDSALGRRVVADLAGKLGFDQGIISSALAFLIPRVVDLLTPDGAVPSSASVMSRLGGFLGGAGAAATGAGAAVRGAADTAQRMTGDAFDDAERVARKGGGILKWLLPLLILALVLWWFAKSCQTRSIDGGIGGDETTESVDGRDVSAAEGERMRDVEAEGADEMAGAVGEVEFDVRSAIERANAASGAALAALGDDVDAQQLVDALNLSIINFATDSAEIPAANRSLIEEAARAMQQLDAETRIEIGGHTDSTGLASANSTLSAQRAEAVKEALVGFGVPAAMLSTRGYGSSEPVADNDTAQGRFRNRRISYTLVD